MLILKHTSYNISRQRKILYKLKNSRSILIRAYLVSLLLIITLILKKYQSQSLYKIQI